MAPSKFTENRRPESVTQNFPLAWEAFTYAGRAQTAQRLSYRRQYAANERLPNARLKTSRHTLNEVWTAERGGDVQGGQETANKKGLLIGK